MSRADVVAQLPAETAKSRGPVRAGPDCSSLRFLSASGNWCDFFDSAPHRWSALGTPIVFWLLLGLGMGSSFRGIGVPGGDSYLQFFFPGTVLMILLFTAIFSTISIIEDRREGFLQSVLVAGLACRLCLGRFSAERCWHLFKD